MATPHPVLWVLLLLLWTVLEGSTPVQGHKKYYYYKPKKAKFSSIRLAQSRTFASGAQVVDGGGVETATRARLDLSFALDYATANFQVRVADGVGITSAQLRCGPAGSNGDVIAELFTDNSPTGAMVDGVLMAGTLDTTSIALETPCGDLEEIKNVATLYAAIRQDLVYLDVRSVTNPDGEVRGQIFV